MTEASSSQSLGELRDDPNRDQFEQPEESSLANEGQLVYSNDDRQSNVSEV